MSDREDQQIGMRLRQAREAKGVRQGELAEQLKIPRSALSMAEAGKRKLSASELLAAAAALKANVLELLGIEYDDAGGWRLAEDSVDYDVRLREIEGLVTMIVSLDLPELGEFERATLVGHLTGALLVSEMRAHGR